MTKRWLAIAVGVLMLPWNAQSADLDDWKVWLDNEYYKIHLNVRGRIEVADFDGLEQSEAYTVRTRLGIGSKPFFGFSAYAEMENIFSIQGGEYFDTVENPTGQAPIADPEVTELNRLFIRYENPEWWNANVVAGRQRITLDDQRFVGNVGWRQNEQTFDAVLASSSAGLEHLTLQYGYLWDIRRIFGDRGPPANRDFDSESHVIRAVYERWPIAKLTLFTYLLDFDGDAPEFSSNSYGFRVHGSRDFAGEWSARYAGSYAFQTDAADNPVDYGASYGAVEVGLSYDPAIGLAVGYEHLGSDDGKARVVTPLATAHKFNGYADVFLGNGGPAGLQDLYVTLSPTLPWKLLGHATYHHFWSDQGGTSLGDEVDAVLSRPLAWGFSALTKFAWFDGTKNGPDDRWRFWVQLTFEY